MATLLRDQFPLLWVPNQDELNGDPRGLLRADNLTLEEDGALTLIRGTKKATISPFITEPTQLFSKTMDLSTISGGVAGYPNYAKVRYAASGGYVLRNYSPTNKNEGQFDLAITPSIIPTNIVGFGFGFGHVWITNGPEKWKDDGIKQTRIGLPAAGGYPLCTAIAGPSLIISQASGDPLTETFTAWEPVENGTFWSSPAGYAETDIDTVNFMAIAMRGLTAPMTILDTMALGGVADTGTPEDTFSLVVRIGDSTKFVKLVFAFLLEDPTTIGTTPDAKNYYQFEWPGDSAFNQGINAWTTLECLRREFTRVGTDESLNWKHVKGLKVTFVNSSYTDQHFVFTNIRFKGGTDGPLTGNYTYIQQDVQNNGYFLEKGLAGEASPIVPTKNSRVKVNPVTINPNANECWVYRKGGGLPSYYLIKKITGAAGFDPAEFQDDLSDNDALLMNIPLDELAAALPDGIIGIEANWKGRNWYITPNALYPSLRDNPSAYDLRYVIETANKNVETNYFITRLSSDTLVLATSADFYEITGSAGILSQDNVEFFDITIRPMGIKSPPITSDFVVREGNLFYLANDGIRLLAGSQCQLLTQSIDLLFKGYNRYGINPLKIETNLKQRYYLNISKNRLYFSTVQSDNKRCLYVFSFEDKNWRYEEHGDTDSIMAMWVEDDDTIIYSTASFGDKFLRILDIGTKFDELNNINFVMRSTFDCNAQPRNRKDSFTLKITADTGGKAINVLLNGFEGITSAVSNEIKTFSSTLNSIGKAEFQWPIYTAINLVKYFQLQLTGSSDFFKLYNWSIDYEPRPEQLSVLRVPPSQFGIAGRKRLQEIPFVIDTLGNATDIKIILDGVAQAAQSFTNNEKTLCTYFFTADTQAFNVGAIIESTAGGVFEFYELIAPREIEQLPDPVKYKWVPYTNFGSAARKRFIQYACVIDTRGQDVTMTPYVDGVAKTAKVINTNRKNTVIYVFDHFAAGIDIACIFSSAAPFEFYELNLNECITEKLPPIARFYWLPYTNFGTSARKRIKQFALVIDTFGFPVTFTPFIDGIAHPPQTIVGNYKQTKIYTFDSYAAGIDVGGHLMSDTPFEYYGLNLEECVYEKLPSVATHLHLAYTNFNTTSRKRFKQMGLIIDTFSKPVTFTPYIDGIAYAPKTIATARKQTALYTFSGHPEAIGIDLGGALESPTNEDFEFYGLSLDDSVYEKLPALAKFIEIGCTNYGVANKKRIRTIPFVIDTFGQNVKFTPTVDGVPYPPSIHNTNGKRTVLHYFENDVEEAGIPFGIDYCGTLEGEYDFEYYELLKPENVELLPVGKKFDQFGPIPFNRVGKIREILIRMVNTGPEFDFWIFAQDIRILKGKVMTTSNCEKTYSIPIPKGVNPNIFRMEMSADTVFHRVNSFVRVNIEGMQTENKWVEIK